MPAILILTIQIVGIIAARIAAASAWAQKVGTPTGAAPQLPGSTSSSSTSAVSEDSSSPGTPAEEYKPITSSLNLDYSSKVNLKNLYLFILMT